MTLMFIIVCQIVQPMLCAYINVSFLILTSLSYFTMTVSVFSTCQLRCLLSSRKSLTRQTSVRICFSEFWISLAIRVCFGHWHADEKLATPDRLINVLLKDLERLLTALRSERWVYMCCTARHGWLENERDVESKQRVTDASITLYENP